MDPELTSTLLPFTEKLQQFKDAPDRNLYRLTTELGFIRHDIPRTVTGGPTEYSVGHSESFWLLDISETKTYQSNFTLELVTAHAYWYVEDRLDINIEDLERSATRFEEDIYPSITHIFGSEWNPGVDNDPKLNILNAILPNIGGYFRSADEYPKSVIPKSNQREIIYINALDILPGSIDYDYILAHELQHAIHWNADASEDTWVNEGLSELASSIALESTFSIDQFLQRSSVSLVHWPTSTANSIANYGAASLFMHFLTNHYGSRDNLTKLLAQPKDGISGINQYLAEQGYAEDFKAIFKQWAAANLLDTHLETHGEFKGYDRLEVEVDVTDSIRGLTFKEFNMPQYAVKYTELMSIYEPFQIVFRGEPHVALLPVDVGTSGCWWSNSGDSIDSTLAYKIEIPTDAITVLDYEVWFDIEEYWDYVYIETSVDDGETWQITETTETSTNNPFGNALGPGYTGTSGGWIRDTLDVTTFAGKTIWVRFQYVTDDAVNASGACFRGVSIHSSGKSTDEISQESNGFAFTENIVNQYFQVQLITTGKNPQVRDLILDSSNSGTLILEPPRSGERLIIAVGSLAEKTREFANYTLSLEPLKKTR